MKILDKFFVYLYAFFFAITVSIVILFFYLLPKKMHKIRVIWAKFHLWVLGVRVQTIGDFDKNANMLIINHQSVFDIMLLEGLYERNISWIAKKEIGEIFFFGKVITMPKMISIDRKNPRDLISVLKQAKERIGEGRVIAIFPEGTRGRGDKLLPFQSGAKIIASKLNAKVQPIVIVGSKNTLDSQKMKFKRNQVVKIIPLDLVDMSDDNWLEKSRESMQEVLKEHLNN